MLHFGIIEVINYWFDLIVTGLVLDPDPTLEKEGELLQTFCIPFCPSVCPGNLHNMDNSKNTTLNYKKRKNCIQILATIRMLSLIKQEKKLPKEHSNWQIRKKTVRQTNVQTKRDEQTGKRKSGKSAI